MTVVPDVVRIMFRTGAEGKPREVVGALLCMSVRMVHRSHLRAPAHRASSHPPLNARPIPQSLTPEVHRPQCLCPVSDTLRPCKHPPWLAPHLTHRSSMPTVCAKHDWPWATNTTLTIPIYASEQERNECDTCAHPQHAESPYYTPFCTPTLRRA